MGYISPVGKTAFIYHPDVEHHETGPGHPECSSRTQRIAHHLRHSTLAQRIDWREPQEAHIQHIEAVHPGHYRRFIEEACLGGGMMVDAGETLVGHDSYRAALLSAGSALLAVDSVMQEGCDLAFSCGRPPGHHATTDKAMGFCLFNNAAIAARYSQSQYSIQRVLIVDWDVHHGNGTHDIFYTDPSVFFFSIHQNPLYPGTGPSEDSGAGPGRGYTLNVPVPARSDINTYRDAFLGPLAQSVGRFRPQLIIISAGFDAHHADPLADINLHAADFGELTRILKGFAGDHTNGKIVSLLEGGYNLVALCECVEAHLQSFCED